MNGHIQNIIDRIRLLETELEGAFREQEQKFRYHVEGTRVRFEQQVREAHREMKMRWGEWLGRSRPLNILSAPVIYSMIVPLALLDISMTLYQHICFRLYSIPRVNRTDYVIMDRHRLAYLNAFEKLNCAYCSYGNGVIAYAREIAARTEQYWCPIKNARRVKGAHPRYDTFVAYGDADRLHEKVLEFRKQLVGEKDLEDNPEKPADL